MGAYRVGTTYAPHNFVYGGSWSTGTVGGYSGGPFNGGRWATGNANTITLTNVYCTSFDIYYTENSFTGNAFKVDVNGNNVLTNSQSGPATESAKRVTITTNLTDGTIVIRAPDASKYFMFNGIALYGATNGVFVHNLGMNGKKIGDYAPSASWATSMPVALTIIDMDANDYSAHTDTNTYGGSFSNFLSYHTNASILVMNGMTNRVAGPPIQSAYWAVERRLTTFNPAILSIDDYWGGYRSEFYYDATHPNQDGHSNIANYVYSKLIQ